VALPYHITNPPRITPFCSPQAFFVRNLLVACWDVLVDSLAEQPTLSPILLRNFRKIMRKWYGSSVRRILVK
jgi:hypothetical protein